MAESTLSPLFLGFSALRKKKPLWEERGRRDRALRERDRIVSKGVATNQELSRPNSHIAGDSPIPDHFAPPLLPTPKD
jgi:hypothetical protein